MNEKVLNEIKFATNENPEYPLLGVIKGRHPFVTDLAGLDLSGTISVLFVNTALRSKMPKWALEKFAHVLWFDGGEFWSGTNLAHLDNLDFPDLRNLLLQLVGLVDPQRIRLAVLEEQFVRFTASIRDQLGIPGPKPIDIEPFTDKMALKKIAEKFGVRTAKFVTFCPRGLEMENPIAEFEDVITYPMFLKPVYGCGGAGTEKISNQRELKNWLATLSHSEKSSLYLAEEYLENAKELNVLAFCQKGKVQFFPCVPELINGVTIFKMIKYGYPLMMFSKDPRIDSKAAKCIEFARNLTEKAFPPLDNSLYFMQIFKTRSSELVLNELACRAPAAVGGPLFYYNTGISPETVQIMGPVKSVNLDRFTKNHTGEHFGMVVYPKVPAEKCQFNKVPTERLTKGGRCREVWVAKEGQSFGYSSNIGDIICRIYLWNKSEENLEKDLIYLSEHYNPLRLERIEN